MSTRRRPSPETGQSHPPAILDTHRFEDVTPGQRLDRWLAARLPAHSRTEVQRWIREGLVRVNGRASKPGYRLETGDVVEVDVPEPEPYEEVRPEPIPLTILYEDEDILVVDKPAGMVVHPAPGHSSGTLVNAILHHCPDLEGVGGARRPGIVHRLDKDTSGLILVAKNDRAHRELQRQFQAREVDKAYLALVEGHLQPKVGRIEAPIGREPRQRKRMAVVQGGREAVTEYTVLAHYDAYTLVDVHPRTGRTHQIRVHFAFIGYPLAGDTVYGRRKQRLKPWLKRLFLHAHRIRFRLPRTGEWVDFTSPLPPDLQAVLDHLAG